MKIKALKSWQKEQILTNGYSDWQLQRFEEAARRECSQGGRRRMARILRRIGAIRNK